MQNNLRLLGGPRWQRRSNALPSRVMRAATLLSSVFLLLLNTGCTSNASLGGLGGGDSASRRPLSPSTVDRSTCKASAATPGATAAAAAAIQATGLRRPDAAASMVAAAAGGEAPTLHVFHPAACVRLQPSRHLLASKARFGADGTVAPAAHGRAAAAGTRAVAAATTAAASSSSSSSSAKGSRFDSEDEAISGRSSGGGRRWPPPRRRALTVRGGGGGGDVAGNEEGGIDEDLYSRQLYVMGKSAMAKMGKADVLISGMRYVYFVVRCDGCWWDVGKSLEMFCQSMLYVLQTGDSTRMFGTVLRDIRDVQSYRNDGLVLSVSQLSYACVDWRVSQLL